MWLLTLALKAVKQHFDQQPEQAEAVEAAPLRHARRRKRPARLKRGSAAARQVLAAAAEAGFTPTLDIVFESPATSTSERFIVLFHERKTILLTLETIMRGTEIWHGMFYANWRRATSRLLVVPVALHFNGCHALSMLSDKVAQLERDGEFVSPWTAPVRIELLHSGDYTTRRPRQPEQKSAEPPPAMAHRGSRFDALELFADEAARPAAHDCAPDVRGPAVRLSPEAVNAERLVTLPDDVRRATLLARAQATATGTSA